MNPEKKPGRKRPMDGYPDTLTKEEALHIGMTESERQWWLEVMSQPISTDMGLPRGQEVIKKKKKVV